MMMVTPTFQVLLANLNAKLREQTEERARYCEQLEQELRSAHPPYRSDVTDQIAKRTASIAELASAIASIARAANTHP